MSEQLAWLHSNETLWTPPEDARERTQVGRFLDWLAEHRGLVFTSYAELWQWSVDDLDSFWRAIWEFFDVIHHASPLSILESAKMPGACWFPGATLNYAENALARGGDADVVLIERNQTRAPRQVTRGELRRLVARARAGLLEHGVEPGDRVAAYMPSIVEAVAAMLATSSLGAIWTACPPEFGPAAVVDRLGQIEPRVLIAGDGYRYGEKSVDRAPQIEEIRRALPSVETTVLVPYLSVDDHRVRGVVPWDEFLRDAALEFSPVAFDHPLWIVFSSGTTGLPKPIVHGHGGIVVEHLKLNGLHFDIKPGDRKFFYSTTGWVVWNINLSALLNGATVVLTDGNPLYPDLRQMWRAAAELEVTHLGMSAAFIMKCQEAGLRPRDELRFDHLRSVLSSGSPLPPEGWRWVYEALGRGVHLTSGSGGTDVASGLVGGSPLLPVMAGRIACRNLGARVEAFDPDGQPVLDKPGELVVTAPMPSMPTMFWNDPGGERLRQSYFDTYPGVWRHGDWIVLTEDGSSAITGRSDATLNRGGVRLGSSEFYTVIEALPEVSDSLVVHLEDEVGGMGELVLFVVLARGHQLDDDTLSAIRGTLARELSPRHVPDAVLAVPRVPRNLAGKKLEVPVKRILQGAELTSVASRGSLQDPDALESLVGVARRRLESAPQ